MQTHVYGEKYTLNCTNCLFPFFLHAGLRTCYIKSRYQHLHLDLLRFIDMPINGRCLCVLLFYWSLWIHAITLSGVTGSRSG